MKIISKTAGSRKPTLGLFVERFPGVEDGYLTPILQGVIAMAQKHNVNLLCVTGGTLHNPLYNSFDSQRNILYKLITKDNVDGLIIMGSVGNYVTTAELAEFHRRYHPLPTVSVGIPLEGISSIFSDDDIGLRNAIRHLITVHHRQRIAFICGPKDVPPANRRYQVYVEVLAEVGYPLDPDLVAPGNFLTLTGMAAVELLLDQRQVHFDSIVAANDNMALGAMAALQARGINVPHEVAIVGFDDIEASRVATLPLTTVRQSLVDLGNQATEMLLAQLSGQHKLQQVILPAQMVIRQSCGCLNAMVTLAGQQPQPIPAQTLNDALTIHYDNLKTAWLQTAEIAENIVPNWADRLLASFAADVNQATSSEFLLTLDSILRQMMAQGHDINPWQGAISTLRSLLPHSKDSQQLYRAETLLHQAQIYIGQTMQRAQAGQSLQTGVQNALFRAISQELVTTVEIKDLMDVIGQELPRLDIKSCYLSLYEDPANEQPYPKWSRLMLAYNHKGRIALDADGQRFLTQQLVPPDLLPLNRYSLVLEALYFREEQFGFVLFEIGTQGWLAFEVLRGQISSALQGALLVRQVQKNAYSLKLANQELQETQERLIRQEKLAFLGQLAGSVGHELRNPLGVITNAVYFLQMVLTEADETVREYLDLIAGRVGEADKIVSDLLNLSRNRVADKAPTSPNELVAEVLARYPAPANVSVTTTLPANLPALFIDAQQIRQVLANLVTNAYQSMPAGGRLTIAAQIASGTISLSISDTGQGMPPDVMEKIFEPLYTTKVKGIGLGLAVSRNLVQVNNGTIMVESIVGQGSTFTLTLPTVHLQPSG